MAEHDDLLRLRTKYEPVIKTMKDLGMNPEMHGVQGGKFQLRGEAPSEEAKNRIWDAIKKVDPTYRDLAADIRVSANAARGQGGPLAANVTAPGGRTYTVQSGDTLSKISKQFYGNANDYNRIFEANKDQLNDPDKIKPGQVLKIPQ